MPSGKYIRTEKVKQASRDKWKNMSLLKKRKHAKAVSDGKKGKPLSEKAKIGVHEAWEKLSSLEKQKRMKTLHDANRGVPLSETRRKALSEWHIAHPNKKFSNSKPEQKIAIELEKRGLIRGADFFQNFGLDNIKNVDFYLPKLNVVIECDGCFYHACKEHGNPNYFQDKPSIDANITLRLKEAGYSVFRFWSHEIANSPEECVNKINI